MYLLPKIKNCPCCGSMNLFRINGIFYENQFKSLKDWVLKRRIDCRKCRIEFGLFINEKQNLEKIVWMDFLKCEDIHIDKLIKLQKNKEKYKEKNKEKEYLKIVKEIENVQNQIRLDQVKVKIKTKIQNKGMII